MLVDSAALERTLAHLRNQGLGGTGLELAVQQVIDAANAVFDVTGTGLMCVDDNSALRYVAASDEPGRTLERAQEEHGVGPCVESLLNDTVVRTTDIREEPRYEPVARIVAPLGVIAVLGVPVHVAGAPIGSLNVYTNEPRAWEDADVEAVLAFNSVIETVVTSAVLSEQQSTLVAQLEHALDHRVVIERAIGSVMERDGVDAVAAFNVLRDRARSERRKVSDVAAELLADRLRAAGTSRYRTTGRWGSA
jgi:GAF domain-containing protein